MSAEDDNFGSNEAEREIDSAPCFAPPFWDFASCCVKIEVLREPDVGVPRALPVGDSVALTVGLAPSYIVHQLERHLIQMQDGDRIVLKFGGQFTSDGDVPCLGQFELSMDSDDAANCLLISLQMVKWTPSQCWLRLGAEEKFVRAQQLKEAGSICFRLHKTDLAFDHYSRSVKHCLCIQMADDHPAVDINELRTLTSQCYLNMAACHLQRECYTDVVHCCTKGLEGDPANVKGLFRRSQAYLHLDLIDEAAQDARQAADVEPQNKAIAQHLKKVTSQLKQAEAGMAQAMNKYFA